MIMSWNTTNACNMYCEHCYRDSGIKSNEELSTVEGKQLIEEVARAGFKIMIFSGGEPLMRPDLYELIAHAKAMGLRPVLGSNGTLITGDVARKLKQAGAMGIGISLDSLDAIKNDQFRSYNNGWAESVQGMKNCVEEDLPFQIHTTVMRWNYDEVLKITDFAIDLGAVAHHIFFLVPTGRGALIEKEAIAKEAYESLLTAIMLKQKEVSIELKPTCAPQFMRIAMEMGSKPRYSRGCLAGTHYCIVSPTGDVQPCAYMDLPIGNVRNTPFSTLWKESNVFKELRTMHYGGACGHCKYTVACGGCRARAAYEHKGNYMESDSLCAFNQLKSNGLNDFDKKVLNRVQSGFPITNRPYLQLADELSCTEEEVLETIKKLQKTKQIKRLGPIFDSKKLGYTSTLCAMKVPKQDIERVSEIVNQYVGVTHNYLREHPYNMWFTLIAPSKGKIEEILQTIRIESGIEDLINLPARNMFKINVNFKVED